MITWKGPDGAGYHYAMSPEGSVLNVKFDPFEGRRRAWSAFVDGERIPDHFSSLIDAKVAAVRTAAAKPALPTE